MGFSDYIVSGVFIIILSTIIYAFSLSISNRTTRSYFIWGAHLKLLGGISFALIHYYYYGGGLHFYGDTAHYFRSIQLLNNLFFEQPLAALKIIFGSNNYQTNSELFFYTTKIFNYNNDPEFFVIRFGTIVSFVAFNNYIVISILYGLFCFWGQWKMFLVFTDLYPTLKRQAAIVTLFMPSIIFWGSGLLKDPLTMGALGFLFSAMYNLLIKRRSMIVSIIFLLIGILILLEVKKYILISFLPACIVWVFYTYATNIKNKIWKILILPACLLIGFLISVFAINALTIDDPIYGLDDFGRRAKISADYLYYVSQKQGGSSYYLGELDGSLESALNLAPSAVIVALYRPFIWEVKNPAMLLSALESLVFLILTLYVLLKVGFFASFYIILKSPFVQFCLVFSIIFAFAIGVTTFNFGSLVRYKIPLIPFYLMAILVIFHQYRLKRF